MNSGEEKTDRRPLLLFKIEIPSFIPCPRVGYYRRLSISWEVGLSACFSHRLFDVHFRPTPSPSFSVLVEAMKLE